MIYTKWLKSFDHLNHQSKSHRDTDSSLSFFGTKLPTLHKRLNNLVNISISS